MIQEYIVIQDFKNYQKNQIIQLQQNELKTTLLIVGKKIEKKSIDKPCFTSEQQQQVKAKKVKKTVKKKATKK